MTAPASLRPRARAYQTPSAATVSGTCSFVRHASAATTANAASRSSSRYQKASSSSGVASATAWNSFSASHWVGGIEQIGERESDPSALRTEVLAGEQEDGHGAEGDGGRLDDEKHGRVGPHPPERREGRQDRVEVRAEPRHLLAAEVRHLEHVAVGRRPDGLHHVAEVEAARVERDVAERRQRAEAHGERRDSRPQEDAPSHRPASNPSSSPRQRRPSTSSLACAWYAA